MRFTRVALLAFSVWLAAAGAFADPVEPEGARGAVRALSGLQSVAGEGLKFEEYAARLDEAKARVDRYLAGPEQGDAELRAAVSEALAFYVLARAAWNAKVTNRFEDVLAVGQDPVLARCPALERALARYPLGVTREQDFARGFVATLEISLIWSCAADRTEEAERLAGDAR